MDAGGIQMSQSSLHAVGGMGVSGLASRRAGGQNIKPLSLSADNVDDVAPTPRTRRDLLAGLRTAPLRREARAATPSASNNPPISPNIQVGNGGNSTSLGVVMPTMPKTAVPQFSACQDLSFGQQYTADQVLAPPQVLVDELAQDPTLRAQLMYQNACLSNQQMLLQEKLRLLQAAAQQFQGLNHNGTQTMPQGYQAVMQQQHWETMQMQAVLAQRGNLYTYIDPATGQPAFYVDQCQVQSQLLNQAQAKAQAQTQAQASVQMHAQLQAQFMSQPSQRGPNLQQADGPPRVQVSSPSPDMTRSSYRHPSPPRRFGSPSGSPKPLPPPSANAFRRGHNKSSSSFASRDNLPLPITTEDSPRSAASKAGTFTMMPLTAGNGPGQARAGEHAIRQPRNPPRMDELSAKPTSKHEGSKNFAARTRRSALTSLVRAGLERRKDARSSGSLSPMSETTDDIIETPLTDNDSDSVRSGSRSLVEPDDAEYSLPSSRTSTASWGAIGSDRPSSRQKLERGGSVDSNASSDNESVHGMSSFGGLQRSRAQDVRADKGGRKKAMLVLRGPSVER